MSNLPDPGHLDKLLDFSYPVSRPGRGLDDIATTNFPIRPQVNRDRSSSKGPDPERSGEFRALHRDHSWRPDRVEFDHGAKPRFKRDSRRSLRLGLPEEWSALQAEASAVLAGPAHELTDDVLATLW